MGENPRQRTSTTRQCMTSRKLALLFIAISTSGLHGAETRNSAAALAFPAVQESSSARAIGLGSTYVGIAEGSAALLWNPAGLGRLGCPEIALHHKSGLLGAYQEDLVLGLPLGSGNALGLSVDYGDNGVFDGRDVLGKATGDYSTKAYGASLGWGISGPQGLGLGAAVKFNRQDLAGSVSSAFAGDLGVLWAPSDLFSLGAAYSNLGPDVNGHPLAQGLRVGLASYLGKGGDFQWLMALSSESLKDSDSSVHAGVEATLAKLLALRAGYAFDIPRPAEVDGLSGWTFGAGITLASLSLDYAFVPLGSLGSTQRISLTYGFGGCGRPVPVAETAPQAKPLSKRAPKAAEPVVSTVPAAASGSYTVKKGDTLWAISNKTRVLGDPFEWPLLYDANRHLLDDPDMIKPRQQLTFQEGYSAAEIKDAHQTAKDTPAK